MKEGELGSCRCQPATLLGDPTGLEILYLACASAINTSRESHGWLIRPAHIFAQHNMLHQPSKRFRMLGTIVTPVSGFPNWYCVEVWAPGERVARDKSASRLASTVGVRAAGTQSIL